MERWIGEQVRRGNEPAAQMGRTLLNLYGDVALPTPTSDLSQSPANQKEVTPIEVRKFTDEAREALAKEGYVIDGLTGQSIASLRLAGRKFWTTWHQEHPQFEALASMQSEVAINPGKLWLPKSNNKTLAQQEQMINKFSEDLSKKIPGVEAIMGGMADYTDLAFAHLDQTGDYLFGEKNGYDYVRTNTPTVGTLVAIVGDFSPSDGLGVGHWDRGRGNGPVFAAPLVVPN